MNAPMNRPNPAQMGQRPATAGQPSPGAMSSPPGGNMGANATPSGNAYGQRFMQQYGSPPGQMRDQFAAFRGQSLAPNNPNPSPAVTPRPPMPSMSTQAGPPQPHGNGWGHMFRQQYGQAPGQMRSQWDAFRQQNGIGSQPNDNPAFAARPGQPRPDMRSLIASALLKD